MAYFAFALVWLLVLVPSALSLHSSSTSDRADFYLDECIYSPTSISNTCKYGLCMFVSTSGKYYCDCIFGPYTGPFCDTFIDCPEYSLGHTLFHFEWHRCHVSNDPNIPYGAKVCPKVDLMSVYDHMEGVVLKPNKKETLYETNGQQFCKIRITATTDGKGQISWAAISIGARPKKPSQPFRNYAFDRNGQINVVEQRGFKIKGVEVVKDFPVMAADDDVTVTVKEFEGGYRVISTCTSSKGLIFTTMFTYAANKEISIATTAHDDFTGTCMGDYPIEYLN